VIVYLRDVPIGETFRNINCACLYRRIMESKGLANHCLVTPISRCDLHKRALIGPGLYWVNHFHVEYDPFLEAVRELM
jgi:hypothetical protein